MEKLIELLNEYEKIKENSEYIQFRWSENYKGDIVRYDDYDQREGDNLQNDTATTYLISKEFGFIKWLVDNDKIDLEKLDEKSERKPQYTFIDDEGRLGFKLFEVYESLLMLLAIQENPIEFLCSVLI